MKEVPNKATGSSYTADEFTGGIKKELQSVITSTAQIFLESDQTQLMQGLALIAGGGVFYTDTGSANSYTINLSTPFTNMTIKDYFNGLMVNFIPLQTNTSASTLKIATLSATNIVDLGGLSLTGGEIRKNTVASLFFQTGSPDKWVLLRNNNAPRVFARIAGIQNGGKGTLLKNVGVASTNNPDTNVVEVVFNEAFPNPNYYVNIATTTAGPAIPVTSEIVVFRGDTSDTTKIQILTATNDPAPAKQWPSHGVSLAIWEA